MRVYRLIIRGRAHYVGTQADARAIKRETGAAWSEVDVPTDKTGLLAFLNDSAAPAPEPVASSPPISAPALQPPRASPFALDAASVLARMDNPDVSVDAIVEGIAHMKGGYALKRVAGAVALRFEELAR